MLGEDRRVEDVAVPRHRADDDLVALDAYAHELRDVVDVDQRVRAREAQLHHRQQAVPAGDDARLLTMLGELRERVGDGRRLRVVDGRRSLQCHHLPRASLTSWDELKDERGGTDGQVR